MPYFGKALVCFASVELGLGILAFYAFRSEIPTAI